VTWHWAHQAALDCDPWFEPETEWHRSWKALASDERVEVVMGDHRADIVSREGTVVELQHSSISVEDIRARESYYRRMVWLIDGSAFAENFRVTLDGDSARFVWAHSRPAWLAARCPKFIHGFSIGRYVRQVIPPVKRPRWVWSETGRSESLFQIRTLTVGRRVEGTGRIIEVARFIERLIA
jgi:hypothetical protein